MQSKILFFYENLNIILLTVFIGVYKEHVKNNV